MILYIKVASTNSSGKLVVSLGSIETINASPSDVTTLYTRNFTEYISTVLGNAKFTGSPSISD